MKIFQIENGFCHWDATAKFPTLDATNGRFPPDVLFVEAPDHVREGWGYLDGEFIQPQPPEGWGYDMDSGTFYPINDIAPYQQPTEMEQLRADVDFLLMKMEG